MQELKPIRTKLVKKIEDELNRVGIIYRIYGREKTIPSAKSKIVRKGYDENKKLQDAIGIRVNLYFFDDLQTVIKLLCSIYKEKNSEIDSFNEETFKPQRNNIVFDLPDVHKQAFLMCINHYQIELDLTFEVQLRTILSEGWHEVEHDLRYKCKDDWNDHLDLSRNLNGVYATLQTSEWSMVKIFDELCYRNYKDKKWSSMLRNKFRIRLDGGCLSSNICGIIDKDKEIQHKLIKINRFKLLGIMADSKLAIPLLYDNLFYIINHIYLRDELIAKLAPAFIKEELELYLN